jgi:hypothetical protein
MALHIFIHYKNQPLTYAVTQQEEDVFHLRLSEDTQRAGDSYVPEKFYIRRKGQIWVSDLEDYGELVSCLTDEIENFQSKNNLRA